MSNSTVNGSIIDDEVFWNAVYSDTQYKISKTIGKYVLFILFVFGSVGNILSFAVMIRRNMRSSSTAFYMASLALADTVVMVIGCLRRWVVEVFDEDLLNIGPVACSTVNFIQYWSFDMAVWILVVMTIDRAIVVIFPLKAYMYATRGRAIIAIASVAVISAGINAHFFFTTIYVEKTGCSGNRAYAAFYNFMWNWVDASVYSFIPFVVLLIMNIIIITALSKANAKKLRMTNNFQSRRKSSPGAVNSRKLSIMLLSVTSAFLLLTAPTVILHILRELGLFDLYDASDMAKYILTRQISRVLLYTNHSINFFLYCITGSKFRKELVAMLCCRSARDRRRSTLASNYNGGSMTNVGYIPTTPERESSM